MELKPQKITDRGAFTTEWGLQITDVREYVAKWLADHEDFIVQTHIGCDSQDIGDRIRYITSICLYKVGKGGHIIKKEDYGDKNTPMRDKLLNEVILAAEIAAQIRDIEFQGAILDLTVHVDYNPNPAHKSHSVYNEGLATGAWLGFKTVGKPNAWGSSKVSDKYTRDKSKNRRKNRRSRARANGKTREKVKVST